MGTGELLRAALFRMTTEPVGLSINLPIQRVMQARIGDTDIAVWRSASGKLAAWLNRCPHRGMRLSHGFVRGESLACLYHGWHYGGDGVCNYIPAHPDLEPPKTIQTTAYSVVDHGGVLWVSTDGNQSEHGLQSEHALQSNNQPVRSITFSSSLDSVRDAFANVSLTDENGADLATADLSKSSNTLLWELSDPSRSVTALLQQPSQHRVIAHILVGGEWSENGLIQISRWSETVRRQAEQSDLSLTSKPRDGS